MRDSVHECYGFRVECRAEDAAAPIVQRFFGPDAGDPRSAPLSRLRVVVVVRERDGRAPSTPPYFPPGWEADDPIVIDLSRSQAIVSPSAGTVAAELAPRDVDNPIVWGRWLLEKAFLMMALRSERHYGLHAGALTLPGGSVLVTAESGVGKSTFVAWALRHGAIFTGDDAIIRHLDDEPGTFWGYPFAAYLNPEALAGWPEVTTATRAAVPGRDKARVEWPTAMRPRLASRVHPSAMLFLTRDHDKVRHLTVDDAASRCRPDFAAGVRDADALGRIEADVHAHFARMALVEFGLSPDLDRNVRVLVELLETMSATAVPE